MVANSPSFSILAGLQYLAMVANIMHDVALSPDIFELSMVLIRARTSSSAHAMSTPFPTDTGRKWKDSLQHVLNISKYHLD